MLAATMVGTAVQDSGATLAGLTTAANWATVASWFTTASLASLANWATLLQPIGLPGSLDYSCQRLAIASWGGVARGVTLGHRTQQPQPGGYLHTSWITTASRLSTRLVLLAGGAAIAG